MIIALAFLLDEGRLVATIVLPLVAAAFLLASTYRGRKRATGPAPQEGLRRRRFPADCLGLIPRSSRTDHSAVALHTQLDPSHILTLDP